MDFLFGQRERVRVHGRKGIDLGLSFLLLPSAMEDSIHVVEGMIICTNQAMR